MSKLMRSLDDTWNWKKISLYALGELFLIVVGIIIALQLDDWQKARSRKSEEISILKEISAGLQNDIDDIKFNIFLHESAIRSAKIILDHFEKNLPYADTLSRHFAGSLYYSRIVINKGAFETLKIRGVDLISNSALRSKIISIYEGRYEGIREFEKNTFLFDSYIAELNAKRFDKTEIYIAFDMKDFERGRMVPYNYNDLRRDRDYIHVLKSSISENLFLINFFMKPLLPELEAVRVTIAEELKKLSE